mmetsp:Transcript_153382/g.265410  ORF Transcript_153382/g.265410 Transcript_153382/m.265410 type:complete len:203 (+) Transcript_153382:3-611(+)
MTMTETPISYFLGNLNVYHADSWGAIKRWADADPIATRGGYSDQATYTWLRSHEPALTLEMPEGPDPYAPSKLFAVYGVDRARASKLRDSKADEHLDWLRESGRVKMAGPLLPLPEGDAASGKEKPIGTLYIVWGSEGDEVKRWAATDPYVKAGLFESLGIMQMEPYVVYDAVAKAVDDEEVEYMTYELPDKMGTDPMGYMV